MRRNAHSEAPCRRMSRTTLTSDLIQLETLGGHCAILSMPPSESEFSMKWCSLCPEMSISCEPMTAWSLTVSSTWTRTRFSRHTTFTRDQSRTSPRLLTAGSAPQLTLFTLFQQTGHGCLLRTVGGVGWSNNLLVSRTQFDASFWWPPLSVFLNRNLNTKALSPTQK